ncbi:ATP synthase subunit I [Chitinasiproducens palmae]|uniref:ATP synthase protein I n=1 Tax=Chitinasiproducens palmae TaxID=1770053 RepID=A0A1H2PPE1_9BURK|nr:ATP synthase subunit I [Chitinasiproducens palmae]SDV48520.1 ATP synthase protein I [Chitinasiproducens palmae]
MAQNVPAPKGPNGPTADASEAEIRRDTGDWRSELDVEREPEIVPLTRAEAESLFGPSVSQASRVTPFKVVAAQVVITLCSMCVAGLLSARPGIAALSALCGGAIGFVPGAWFAWRLGRAGSPSALRWAVAEGVKVAATVALFAAVAIGFRDVRWLPLLLTFVLVLKTYWIALFWR